MRTPKMLLIGLAIALVLGASGAALAQPPSGGHGAQGSDHANEAAGNHTSNESARHAALREARQAALDAFKDARQAALAAFHAAMNATRASFKENKTAVIDACKAAHNETTGNESASNGKCVRDGLKPLVEKAHGEIRAAQQAFRHALETAREGAKAGFRHAKDHAPASG